MKTFILFILFLLPVSAQDNRLTAREVIDRIQKNVGVPWRTDTVDTIKAGDPNLGLSPASRRR